MNPHTKWSDVKREREERRRARGESTPQSVDPIIPLHEAAVRLGLNARRTRSVLVRNGIRPVRTWNGLGYRADDVEAVRRMCR